MGVSARTAPHAANRPRGIEKSWQRLLLHPYLWVGGGILLLLLVFCFLGPALYGHPANHIDVSRVYQPPSLKYPLGTDGVGQNMFVQMMVGGRVPIAAGFVTALLSSLFGIAAGLVASFSRGAVDNLIMRVADAVFGIPQIVPVLFIEAVLGATTQSLILTIALTSWPVTAQLIRSRALLEREMPYVEAARAAGASRVGIVLRHVLPNLLDTVVASVTTQFGNGVILIAIATVVGLGLAPPWNWASMIGANIEPLFGGYWWLVVPPGLALSLLLLSVHLIGEAIRHAANPKEMY